MAVLVNTQQASDLAKPGQFHGLLFALEKHRRSKKPIGKCLPQCRARVNEMKSVYMGSG